MRYFEAAGFCDMQEYEASKKERLQASDLRIDELYIVMFALCTTNAHKAAAKFPARVLGSTAAKESDLYAVKLDVLDHDMRTCVEATGVIRDGYWLNVKEQLLIGKTPTEAAYLKGYEDYIDKGLRHLVESVPVLQTA